MSGLGNKNIMAENIKKNMKSFGIDRRRLSDDLGISYTTVSDWINAKTYPRIDKIEMMATYFGITKADLIEKEGSVKRNDISSIYNQLSEERQTKVYEFATDQLKEQNSNIVDLRKYRDIYIQSKVSAGRGIVDLDQEHKDLISYSGYVPAKYDLAFQVEGDSMQPLFENGEVIFVECDSEVRNGQIGVVLIDDEAFVKKMYVEDEQLRLVSLNKKYDDITVSKDIKIVGRAII